MRETLEEHKSGENILSVAVRYPVRLSTILGSVVVMGVGTVVALYLLLHILRPDYNPLQRFLSEYAVGRFGVLMKRMGVSLPWARRWCERWKDVLRKMAARWLPA